MSYSAESLKKMLILSQQGDKDAYKNFLMSILPLIHSIFSKKIFHKDDTSDVIQEILLSIHKALPSYDSKRPVLPWVLAISERRIIDYIRKVTRKNKNETLTKDGSLTSFEDEAKRSVHDLEILYKLPYDIRRAIELTKIDGYSTKEAANILGINENALRTRVSRGMSKLKNKMKADL